MSNWTPMPPKYGPPIPQGLDSFIPFKGYWPWAQPAVKTIPSGYNLQVILVNPDPAATVWQMTIFDNKYTQTLAVQNLKVTDPALFNVPSNWAMPLKIASLYSKTLCLMFPQPSPRYWGFNHTRPQILLPGNPIPHTRRFSSVPWGI